MFSQNIDSLELSKHVFRASFDNILCVFIQWINTQIAKIT